MFQQVATLNFLGVNYFFIVSLLLAFNEQFVIFSYHFATIGF